MSDKWLEEIREKISCPQLGDEHYGEWGILTKYQRFTIKRMLDYIESQEQYINRLQAENERLKKGWKADIQLTAEVKAEAYKEFAERLQKKIDPTLIAVTMIGNILVEVSKSHITADNAIEKIREYLKDLEIETRLSFDMAVCDLLKEMVGEDND